MDYSIIIPAYNEEKYIVKTLECLGRIKRNLQDKYEGEIIVVDNNSTDGTGSAASGFGARVVFEKINCIAKARNAGAAASSAKFLIFVDADTLVSEELVSEALNLMSDGKAAGGGAEIGFYEDDAPKCASQAASIWNLLVRIFPNAAGSFVFCTRDAWNFCHGFNENFYAAEEILFSAELRKYARRNKVKFKVIRIPVRTSARKFKWHKKSSVFMKMLFFVLFPFALKSRKLCSFWYQRPKMIENDLD